MGRWGVFSVHESLTEPCLAIANLEGWLEFDEPQVDAIFDTQDEARDWANENYPAYFIDPRDGAHDWKEWGFEVREI